MHNEIKTSRVEEIHCIYGKIYAFTNDLITDQIRKYGGHTRPEFSFATSIIQHDEKIFDIGAHIGTFSLLASKKSSHSGRILAVEGNSETFSVLKENVKSLKKIQCANAFISDGEGNFKYVLDESNSGAGHLVEGGEIPTWSIDKLTEQFFSPTFIKIDIEGLEMAAIGKSEYIKKKRPTIYTEVGKVALRRSGSSPEELVGFFKKNGYELYVNIGPRNAPHDLFQTSKLPKSWIKKRPVFDILCVPKESLKNTILASQSNMAKAIYRKVRAHF